MAKRAFDILLSSVGLLLLWPFLLLCMILIWLQDFRSPLYVAERARARGKAFKMYKLRSMVSNADKLGGVSTAANDRRITWIGKIVRKSKFDEVPQLWNVLRGDMSLVGPRPQVVRDVELLYTKEENRLLDARPGITDLASIVFSDEGEILKGSDNPDLKYNQIIRPWKSRLGILYTQHQGVLVDLRIIALTLAALVSKDLALRGVQSLLGDLRADNDLVEVASRRNPLRPYPPPGATELETRW